MCRSKTVLDLLCQWLRILVFIEYVYGHALFLFFWYGVAGSSNCVHVVLLELQVLYMREKCLVGTDRHHDTYQGVVVFYAYCGDGFAVFVLEQPASWKKAFCMVEVDAVDIEIFSVEFYVMFGEIRSPVRGYAISVSGLTGRLCCVGVSLVNLVR